MDECIPKFRNFRYAGGHNKVGVLQSLGATIQAVFILRGWRSIGCSAEVGRQNACSVRHVARGRGSETNYVGNLSAKVMPQRFECPTIQRLAALKWRIGQRG